MSNNLLLCNIVAMGKPASYRSKVYSEEKLMITTPLSALRHAKWTYEQQFGNIRAIKLLLSIHYLEFNDQLLQCSSYF